MHDLSVNVSVKSVIMAHQKYQSALWPFHFVIVMQVKNVSYEICHCDGGINE